MSELPQPGILALALALAPAVGRHPECVHLPALDALDGAPDQQALNA